MQHDVFGMCNALYDIQAEVPDATLQALGLTKGTMSLIDADQQQELVSQIYQYIVNAAPGGSGANTMIGLAQLGGTASYTSKVGSDEHGHLYNSGLQDMGINVCTASGEGVTGISVILVTPDAERTMCTFLGISREIGPADLNLDSLRNSKFLYVTGYLWDTDSQKAAVVKAMETAQSAGVHVALSLSDPFCVARHKADFLEIAHKHVSLLIGNHEEMQALTDCSTPHDAIRAVAPYCDLAAVTMGARGSLLRKGNTVAETPGYPVHAVDSTGAGDMFAAGLLYGLTHDVGLERTGRIANWASAQVVAHLGPRLPGLDKTAIPVA